MGEVIFRDPSSWEYGWEFILLTKKRGLRFLVTP